MKVVVYRLLRQAYAATPFDGTGSYMFGGRWSSRGTRVVYTSEHVSLAMVEYLAHLDPAHPPKDIVLAKAEIPDEVLRLQLTEADLPGNWHQYPAPPDLTTIGDAFVQGGRAAVLILPSVLSRTENNWLLNPAHPDFAKIKLGHAEPFPFDPRLI